MIECRNLIQIGATGRNSGKTTLACALIQRLCQNRPVFALKITAIKERNGKCPRGGQGCGTCSAVHGDFQLVEELDFQSKKDTSLMKAAGAEKVYWLKVMSDCLEAGFCAFLETVPADAVIVCESNSLRKVVLPGFFAMIKNTSDFQEAQIKESAESVIQTCDLLIEDLNEQNVWEYSEKILREWKVCYCGGFDRLNHRL